MCPTCAAGQPLSPKNLILGLRDALHHTTQAPDRGIAARDIVELVAAAALEEGAAPARGA